MRRSVLASAIPDVATVLRTLIYDYAYPSDYECVSLPVSISTTTLSASIDGKQRLYHPINETESTSVFVSKTTLRTGCGKWTFAWTWTTDGPNNEIGIGVTTANNSYRNRGFSTACDPSASTSVASTDSNDDDDSCKRSTMKRGVVWIGRHTQDFFCDWPTIGNDFRLSNLQQSTVDGFAADGVVYAVADLDTLQVRFRFADSPDDDGLFVVQVSTPDEFWSLRPLIAFRHAVEVRLFSNDSTD